MMSAIDHPEVLQLLEDLDPEEVGETVVVFRCPSGYHGKVIGGRWLIRPCRGKNCRGNPDHTHHAWDIQTGELRLVNDEPMVAQMKGT